jgi:SAM-dependent methyltransferase
VNRIGMWLDRCLGRGSYRWSRALDPQRTNMQAVYARTVRELLDSRVRWLDAGCGRQAFPQVPADQERAEVGRVRLAVGCDASHPALHAHRSLRNRVCCNLDQLPFAACSFDVITLGMVAEHLSRPESVFAELARVLAPDGVLVVFTPNAAGYSNTLIRAGNRLLPRPLVLALIRFLEGREEHDVFPALYRANTRRRLEEIAAAAGLIEEGCLLRATLPLSYFLAPLAVVELLAGRLLRWLGFEELVADNILAVYRPASCPQTVSAPPEALTVP